VNYSSTSGDDDTSSHLPGIRLVRVMNPQENATSLETTRTCAPAVYTCEEDVSCQSLQSTNCHRHPQERSTLECGPLDPLINTTNPCSCPGTPVPSEARVVHEDVGLPEGTPTSSGNPVWCRRCQL
jgi:hypothetical protein